MGQQRVFLQGKWGVGAMRAGDIRAHKLKAKAMLIPLIRPFTDSPPPAVVRVFLSRQNINILFAVLITLFGIKIACKTFKLAQKTGDVICPGQHIHT